MLTGRQKSAIMCCAWPEILACFLLTRYGRKRLLSINLDRRCYPNAAYLSTQEASQSQSAWLPPENVHHQWPEGPLSPSCQRPQGPVRLILCARECGITPSKMLIRGEWKDLLFAPCFIQLWMPHLLRNPVFLLVKPGIFRQDPPACHFGRTPTWNSRNP